MKKSVKILSLVVLIIATICVSILVRDKLTLKNDIIRLHVVGNSNSNYDQNVKIAVKDGIIIWLQENLNNEFSIEEAKAFILENSLKLEDVANEILGNYSVADKATVSFKRESFDTRQYDTFKLPAGVYQSLRIEIGKAEGRNWWCVVFPALCLPTSTEAFCQTASSSGMDNGLAETLSGDEEYEIRFYFLDLIGKIENLFSPR